MQDIPFKVLVRCFTFNQALYIKDAMDGFCMQRTDFPYLCAIVDDCSTDGEPSIIQSYLAEYFSLDKSLSIFNDETNDFSLVFARHNENENCFFAVYFLKYNHYQLKKKKSQYLQDWFDRVSYVALCEGDDYWTAPNKLQKQSSFMDEHPDYSMCFHGSAIIAEKTLYDDSRLRQFDGLETKEYSINELSKKWIIPTASIFYRSGIVAPKDSRFLVGDLPFRMQCAKEGRVYCFKDSMAVYRLHESGVSFRSYSSEQLINHIEALLDHFPEARHVYYRKYIETLRSSLFSRNCFKVLTMWWHEPHKYTKAIIKAIIGRYN